MNNYDIKSIRADFPILSREVKGKPLVYLDNAATSLKPAEVIDAVNHHYRLETSNVHRGVHFLSSIATEKFENAREQIRDFINASSDSEIIFTGGTTESINLVAFSYANEFLQSGDEILVSEMEHHSNIVPWQIVCNRKGLKLKVIPIDSSGRLVMDEFHKKLNEKVKIVAVTYISNALGTINPVREIAEAAHKCGAVVLVDAAQAVSHRKVDVKEIDCDFLAFSGHKMFGPTGIGILYGKEKYLEKMPPYQGGGEMIARVTFEKTIYSELPYKFEAGTPPIAQAIGIGAAAEYIQRTGIAGIENYEQEILKYATETLSRIDGIRIIGTAENKSALISFTLSEIHPHDMGTFLDDEGIAVRTGHHCAQPVMSFFDVPATTRASFSLYTTREEIDVLYEAIQKARRFFR